MSGTRPTRPDGSSRRSTRKQAALAAQKRKRQRLILALAAGAAVIVAVALIILSQENGSDDTTELSSVPEVDWATIPQDGMTLGDPNAPVTIIEYADYQCPACGNFAREVLPRIVDDYVLTGKVKVEFRVIAFLSPKPMDDDGNESVQAAEAASCALDQGRYWEFNEALFTNQEGENDGAFSNANLANLASDLGLDRATFTACLDQDVHQQEILESRTQAEAAGVTQTPTLVINGETVYLTTEGYPRLRIQIDEALNEVGA